MRQLKILKSITNRDSASLDKYLQDISKLPMVDAEEEIALTVRIRKGDMAALEALVNANLRFVVSVAKQYQNQGVSLNDLVNEGNLGLIKAASRFDETRGFKFISYAVWWIRQSVMQAVSEQSRIVRIPLNKAGMLNRIRRAQSALEQDLGRSPAIGEISAFMEVEEKELLITLQAGIWHVSTDEQIGHNEPITLLDLLADNTETAPDRDLVLDSFKAEVQRSLGTLTTRERDIIVLFFGIGLSEPLSLLEIGEKFELTRERVRQIKEKAIRKLRKTEKNRNLRSYLS